MSSLDSMAGWAASSALIGFTLLPLTVLLAVKLRRNAKPHAQAARLAHILIQVALPVSAVGVALDMVIPAVFASNGSISPGSRLYRAAVYISVTSSFVLAAAAIAIAAAIYVAGLGVLYLVLGSPMWWKLLRIDVLSGAGLLLILDIVYWAWNMSAAGRGQRLGKLSLAWLLVIVDLTLALLAVGKVGLAIYIWPRFKTRGHLVASNIRALLLSASVLWLFRCVFVSVVDIKTLIPDWTRDEAQALKILHPIFDLWVSTTVLGLLVAVFRHPVWSDPTAIVDAPEQAFVQQPVSFLPPENQHPPPYHDGQHSVLFQQARPALSPDLVPAARIYEADAAARGPLASELEANQRAR